MIIKAISEIRYGSAKISVGEIIVEKFCK